MHAIKKWEKAARRRRQKAFFYTFVIHIALFGCILLATNTPVKDYLPKFLKGWLGIEKVDEVVPAKPIP